MGKGPQRAKVLLGHHWAHSLEAPQTEVEGQEDLLASEREQEQDQ